MTRTAYCLAYFMCLSFSTYAQTDSLPKPKFFGYGLAQMYSSEHSKALVVPSTRKKWIKSALKSMNSLLKDSAIEVSQPHIINIPDFQKIAYRIKDCKKVLFENGDSVLICLHSVHQDPKVGDVCIAMDSKLKFYVNYGHICGGMINFECMRTKAPLNIKDFIQNFVSDTDKEKWVKW